MQTPELFFQTYIFSKIIHIVKESTEKLLLAFPEPKIFVLRTVDVPWLMIVYVMDLITELAKARHLPLY